MNILIVKLSAIGDVVHTLPSLAALRSLYPQAHITWVVEAAAADLIDGHPYLDRVLVSHRKRWFHDLKSGLPGTALKEAVLFIKTLRDRPYDLIIDFHGLFKSAVIVGLSNGVRKLGYDSMQEGSGFFYTEKIPEDMDKHAVERYLDFPAYLGAGSTVPEFLLPVTAQNDRKVSELLKKNGIEAADAFIAINPVALWDTKLWRPDRFAALIDRLAEEGKLPVVITGSPGEKSYAATIIRAVKRAKVADLTGQTTLKDLACLYRKARLVVTTDSGPMHIAAAVGTQVVALFGPTDPRRTGPYGPGHTVIRKMLPCSPCFRKECPTRECMEGITVAEVLEGIKEILRREKIEAAQAGKK